MQNIYMKEINQIPLMSSEEEKKVAALAFQGNKAAQDKLVKANLRFVVKQAHKFLNQGLELEDLISEGNAGLMYAATKFDPAKNTKFITYAVWWINQYMRKAVYEKGQDVKITVGRKDALSDSRFKMARLDKVLDSEEAEGATVGDLIEDKRYMGQEERVCKEDEKSGVYEALDKLSREEQIVICYRFGLYDSDQLSLKSIGDMLGYSKERIRQIESRALTKLRRHMEDYGYAA